MAKPATDPISAGLVAALRREGVAGVDGEPLRRALYSSDASLYRVVPAAVAVPRDIDQVLAAVAVCRELSVPLTVRGAGTSIAGNAIGPGLVLDLSRHLNRITELDPETRSAVVEPGVVQASLQRAAAARGLRFGPDPSTSNRCTIGGMIGNNACGARALGYGRTSDNVLGLDLISGTGERLRLGDWGRWADADGSTQTESSPTLAALRELVEGHLGLIRTEFGRFSRQVSGYALEHLLPERGFDVTRALVGSEGTLGVVLGARVRLVEEPGFRALVVLGYPTMADAADAVPALLALQPTACEGLDARIVDAVRRQHGAARVPELPRGAGWLMVEVVGQCGAEVRDAARAVVAVAGALDSRVVSDVEPASMLWRIREDGAGLSSRTTDGRPAHAGWEDAAVPPEVLGAYLREFEALLVEHSLTGLPYGHFGEGCLHVRLDFAFDKPDGTTRFRAFLFDAAHLLARYGGSLSGEHGDGRARSELLPSMYTPEALGLFRQVKATFDEQGLLNPGVLVDPAPLDRDLRPGRVPPVRAALALGHHGDDGDFAAAVNRCNGVGKCRADRVGEQGVMCPSFAATRDEKDSTRGRARVLQEMLDGTLVTGGWRAPEVGQALDLCLSCKACSSECPTGVDLARYKAEVLHQAFRGRLRPRSHYLLGRLPSWARWAARAPRLANALIQAPVLGPAGRWMAGVDRRRSLPRFAEQTFRGWFESQPMNARHMANVGRPVLLWVDTFTDLFAPQVGKAAVAVLQRAGYDVRIPSDPVCCGLTWITTGQLDGARRRLSHAVRVIEDEVEAGMPVIGLEPSCTGVLRSDLVELVDGPVAARLARQTRTLAEILTETPGWQPPSLSGLEVVAQPHCHHSAVMGWDADAALLIRARARLQQLGGCCGLAGNFGVERGHYEISLAIAEQALLPAVRAVGLAADSGVVLADGFSCRTQLDDLVAVPSLHLAELLARELPERP